MPTKWIVARHLTGKELVNIAFALVVGALSGCHVECICLSQATGRCFRGTQKLWNCKLQQSSNTFWLCAVQTETEALDLPQGELLSFALQRLVKQACINTLRCSVLTAAKSFLKAMH